MKNNLVWVDLEFSGLDYNTEVILEIATIITDDSLKIIAEGPNLAIHHSDSVLEAMDEWNTEHHGKSGLIDRVKKSADTHQSAEEKTLDFIRKFCEKGQAPLCGNSVHMDRQFIRKYMPDIDNFLHYRIIDVSTIKELSYRWYADLEKFIKQEKHEALEDIRESIAELQYYREKVFKESLSH